MFALFIKDIGEDEVVHHEVFENEEDMSIVAMNYAKLSMYNNHLFYKTEIIASESVYN